MTNTARFAAILGLTFAVAGCTVHQTVPPGVAGPSDESTTFAVLTAQPVVNVPVAFDGSASRAGAGASQITSFKWDFGDGSVDTTSGSKTTHTFKAAGSFNVVLTTTDDRGRTSSIGRLVQVRLSDAPKVDFAFSPSPAAVNDLVQFTAQVTAAPGRTIVKVDWNFGEPSSSTNTASGETVTHTFQIPGTFSIEVTATDDAGQVGSVTKPVAISDGKPLASFIAVPSAPHPGDAIVFNASASKAFGSATIVSYTWFGIPGVADGSVFGQPVVQSPGSATARSLAVTLIVTDDRGRTGTVTQEIKVTAPTP
jgi:plastocyanin